MEVLKVHVPDGCEADYAVGITDGECEPYIKRGGTAYVRMCGELKDGDVGFFFDGHRAVIRQYCEDWAGNAHLLVLNRRLRERDVMFTASEGLPVCLFGQVLLPKIPLPER